MDLELTLIKTDGGTQPRAMLDMFVVDDYAQAMQGGATFPPVVVFYDGADYWLADGFHRVRAAANNGAGTINADIRQGTRRDAILYSVGANASHGLRRTNADKRRAVETLLNDPEWSKWSDGEIARRCAVSQAYVTNLRPVLTNNVISDRTYTTKHGTVSTMKTAAIGQRIAPEVRELLQATPVRDDHRQIKQLESFDLEQQLTAAKKILSGEATGVKDAIRKIWREENTQKVIETKPVTGLYPCIVIDPPWSWDDEGDADQFGRLRPNYHTMSFEEVAALEIPAENDAHLYLWITNRSLPKGFTLLEKWGFRYITTLTWCKPSIGVGNYFRNNTEHVLFGVRGSLPLLRADLGTHFTAQRGRHSEKPQEFFDLVRTCSPGPWLEMFARETREGWESWGAEVA